MTLVSVTAYGKLHGVSKTAAQKWQSRGLLVLRDGKVDVEASDRSLVHAGVGRFAPAATKQNRTATSHGNPVADPVADLAAGLAKAEDDPDALLPVINAFMQGLTEGRVVDLITAQTLKENGLALIRLIEARKRAGEVVEMAEAESVIFEMFRLQRDAWRNFPSRIGPLMAADLGLSPDRVVEVLTVHVHQHLTDLGEPVDPIRQAGPAETDGPKGVDAAAAA